MMKMKRVKMNQTFLLRRMAFIQTRAAIQNGLARWATSSVTAF